jgi:hypothetical protein
MVPSLAYRQQALRLQAPVPTMHGERVWNTVTRRATPQVRSSDGVGPRRRALDEGVLVVCFVLLVGVAVLGGLLALFYGVAATLPERLIIACPDFDGCEAPAPAEDQAVLADDGRLEGPTITP